MPANGSSPDWWPLAAVGFIVSLFLLTLAYVYFP
jgi:hypothetical protein